MPTRTPSPAATSWLRKGELAVCFVQKCIEWKSDLRMTPEMAFSHPFISKAVNELKCLRTGSQRTAQQAQEGGPASGTAEGNSRNTAGQARTGKTNQ